MTLLERTQGKLEAAERREDWVAVLSWDRVIDLLSFKAAGDQGNGKETSDGQCG